MLVPMNEMKKDDLSRLEKMKQLPKQLKFILQTDRKYKVEARRKVRSIFEKRVRSLVFRATNEFTYRKHARRILCVQYVQSTYRFIKFSRRKKSTEYKHAHLYVPTGQNVSILINCGHGLHSECKVWFENDQKLAYDLERHGDGSKEEETTTKTKHVPACLICLIPLNTTPTTCQEVAAMTTKKS